MNIKDIEYRVVNLIFWKNNVNIDIDFIEQRIDIFYE